MEDPADFFCELFADLHPGPFRDGRALDWLNDADVWLAAWTVAEAVRDESLDAAALRLEIAGSIDPERRRFEILRGLDEALGDAHPLRGAAPSGVLADVADRCLRDGRFNTSGAAGELWARYGAGVLDAASLETPRAAFANVLHVAPEILGAVSRELLADPYGPGPGARAGLRFACAPMLETYAEVEFATPATGYALGPKAAIVAPRVDAVLDGMDAAGAVVGAVPEASLDRTVLARWRDAVDMTSRPAGGRLSLILAGTGPIDGAVVRPRPANEAVMIDRLTGDVLLRQRKRSRFTLTEALIDDWRLGAYVALGLASTLPEDIVLGDELALLDSTLGRLAVAVCEDAARLAQLAPLVLDAGVSILLVPVFSKELREHFWEDSAAKSYFNGMGAQVLVVNSLAVTRAREAASPMIDRGPVDDDGWFTAQHRAEDFKGEKAASATDVVVVP